MSVERPLFCTYSPDWTALQLIDETRRRTGCSMRTAIAYAKAHHALRVGVADLLFALIRHVNVEVWSVGYSEWFVDEGLAELEHWKAFLRERERLRPLMERVDDAFARGLALRKERESR